MPELASFESSITSFKGSINTTEAIPTASSFTLTTPSPTDLWRKPPSLDVSNCPIHYRPIRLSSFISARVTVSSQHWTRLYDQGGLVFLFPNTNPVKWVKTGIEFVDGKAQLSTVTADRWSDWSLVPLGEGQTSVTIEIEREKKGDEWESSLWVYVIEGGERRGVREVTWVFDETEDAVVHVGVYCARPTKGSGGDESEELEVKFEGFELKIKE